MRRREDIVRIDPKEIDVNEMMGWFTLDRNYWRTLLNVALSLRVP